MANEVRLYLCEKESSDEEGGCDRWLDIIIALEPWGDEVRRTLDLGRSDIIRLSKLERGTSFTELYKLFNITDLSDKPGYPKGPYYHVDECVYHAISNNASLISNSP